MKQFKYLGQLYNRACEFCGVSKFKQKMFERQPHPAVAKLLVDTSPKVICKKCAQKDIGSKKKKEIDELEEIG